jgi:hypothetical protein
MKNTEELKNNAAVVFEQSQRLSCYTSVLRAVDNNLYELGCRFDVIDNNHPKADQAKQLINDLINLSSLLLNGYESEVERMVDLADNLNGNLSMND